jgi:3-hydroxy-9,10-secoandrosta-1,3,5(10)-triene-9,17-dione monooxygenase
MGKSESLAMLARPSSADTQPVISPEDCAAYRERALKAGREFLERIDAIVPLVRANRAESERLGRVADASVAAMVEAGVFAAFTPMCFGGLELPPADFFDGVMRLGAADPSAAWIGGQLTVHSFEIALMDERAQREFWADGPSVRASSSYAPIGKATAVDGGYVLNGTWTFSSGVDHSTWVILGGGERNFLVPLSEVTIDHNSWKVQGLKGTGSKAVTLKDVFVPQYRVHELADTFHQREPGWSINNRPLFRLSFPAMFNSTMSNAAIGMTNCGLQEFIAQTRVRLSRQGTGAAVSTNPFMQLRLASALAKVRSVRLRHLDNWRRLFDMVCSGEEITMEERLRVRFEASDAAGTCFEAFCDLWQHAGAGAVADSNPLQNAFRDLMAMRNHGSAGRDAAACAWIGTMFGQPGPSTAKLDMGTLSYYR